MQIATTAGFDRAIDNAVLYDLVAMLVERGLPQQRAASYFLSLAERCRAADVGPAATAHRDIRARQFEDMGSKILGGGMMPRD